MCFEYNTPLGVSIPSGGPCVNRLRLSLCILLFTVPILAADQFASVRDSIRVQLVQRQLPSVAVAVAKGDKIIWEAGFGWANREKRIPASEHITYSLASISKPISATALMTLVKAGNIRGDARGSFRGSYGASDCPGGETRCGCVV
jgi:CubicO group peptidase (beta-lactamase class C family)